MKRLLPLSLAGLPLVPVRASAPASATLPLIGMGLILLIVTWRRREAPGQAVA